MVAVIKTGASINRAFYYNERKVMAGVADCIMAANYPKDLNDLTQFDKLQRLLKQSTLNEKVACNSVHISLNFAPSETFSPDRLVEIAGTYMEKIGFGEQPYLVYQHHDAGHPHLHIVSLCIRADGSRIHLHNIGRNQSEKARKEIEESFGLVKASGEKQRQTNENMPEPVQLVKYGATETKKAIGRVLNVVLKNYRYTSLPELNAVLSQFNVIADPGSEKSRLHQHHGLTYSVLDEQGKKIGVPIKASDFANKPTFLYLEGRFKENEINRQPHKSRVKNAIDLALLKQPGQSLESLLATLNKEGIHTVRRENEAGMIYGLTYIDHKTKCVFNGSDLGKPYSAKGLQGRCRPDDTTQFQTSLTGQQAPQFLTRQDACLTETPDSPMAQQQTAFSSPIPDAGKVLDLLLQPEPTPDYIPSQLKRKTRKKKRTHISGNQ